MNGVWSPEEDERLLAMRAQGFGLVHIGEQLGRTKHAVKDHLRKLRMTEDQRANYLFLKSQRRFGKRSRKGLVRQRPPISSTVPPEVLEDRNRRLMARMQMDLTGQICGDPIPGFSALEKRA